MENCSSGFFSLINSTFNYIEREPISASFTWKENLLLSCRRRYACPECLNNLCMEFDFFAKANSKIISMPPQNAGFKNSSKIENHLDLIDIFWRRQNFKIK